MVCAAVSLVCGFTMHLVFPPRVAFLVALAVQSPLLTLTTYELFEENSALGRSVWWLIFGGGLVCGTGLTLGGMLGDALR